MLAVGVGPHNKGVSVDEVASESSLSQPPFIQNSLHTSLTLEKWKWIPFASFRKRNKELCPLVPGRGP